MAYTITINAVDRTGDVIAQSVTISDVINDKQNTCTFKLMDLSVSGMPSPGEEITILDADGVKVFGGYVTRITLGSKRKTGAVLASVECVDYVWLLDRNLAHITYEDMTDSEIINELVNRYCPGFGITTTSVVEGITIDQISFNYIQISQCLRQLCDLTGRNWYIDYDKVIHYFPLTTEAAPFNIGDESTIFVSDTMIDDYNGTLSGDASHVAGEYVLLTDNAASEAGAIYYEEDLGTIFTSEFEWQLSPADDSADAVFFFWGCTSIPTTETSNAGGYIVAYDHYEEIIYIKFGATLLAAVETSNIIPQWSAEWRSAKIDFSNDIISVYLDETWITSFTDSTRTLPGVYCGLGARTNAEVFDSHAVRNLSVYNPTSIDYTDLTLKKDASQIKNRVYVRGGTKLSDFTTYAENGDGVKRQFVLPDKPHDISIEVNDVSKTIGIKHIHTSGYDWYVNYEEKYIEQDSGGAVLTTSDTLEVIYKYDIPILVALENAASIEEVGQKEFAIFDKKITTTNAARDRANAELTDYAGNIIEGSFTTHTSGFISGQYININLTDYDVNANYIVQSVQAKSLGAGLFTYKINIASSKTIGIIRFLIELLENNRNLIELDDNESIDELFNITDALLSDSLLDDLTIDSAGAYFTWVEDSPSGTIKTRAKWDLFQWG